MDTSITSLLNNLVAVDQCLRKNKEFSISLMHKFDEMSTEIIKVLVHKFGLPTPENVGTEAAKNFIVLLIHTSDIKYASKLARSRKFKETNYNKTELAILIDRILLHEGKKQRFGTVIETKKDKSGRYITKPLPIKDVKSVDKRRKESGLPPLVDYLKSSEEIFKSVLANKPK
ncbi:hypothetical protein KJ605_01585 [Patescibacteria group bacterium]|nr:hypothetical protein [Patescibacteria group bacterium]